MSQAYLSKGPRRLEGPKKFRGGEIIFFGAWGVPKPPPLLGGSQNHSREGGGAKSCLGGGSVLNKFSALWGMDFQRGGGGDPHMDKYGLKCK